MGRRKTTFGESLLNNNRTYIQYVRRLTELAISRFEWTNLPDSVDYRYLELALLENGSAVYFRDEIVGDLALSVVQSGNFNVYGYPIERRAYSIYNGYQRSLTENDSVIIYNNMLRTNSVLDIEMFAKRLYNLDRIIDVNANAQKTPILIQGSETQKLTLQNLYKEYEGNAPVIFGDKSLDLNALSVLTTNAPYVCDKIYELKTQIWNEALTYLGISNVSVTKKERLITDEVQRNQGGVLASRNSYLSQRKEACEKINQLFGTNLSVEFREFLSDSEELAFPQSEEVSEDE